MTLNRMAFHRRLFSFHYRGRPAWLSRKTRQRLAAAGAGAGVWYELSAWYREKQKQTNLKP